MDLSSAGNVTFDSAVDKYIENVFNYDFCDSRLQPLLEFYERTTDCLRNVFKCYASTISSHISAVERYKEESNTKLLEQEQELIDSANGIRKASLELRKEKETLIEKSRNHQRLLSDRQQHYEKLLRETESMQCARNKTVFGLERTKRSFGVAVRWYARYMGLRVLRDSKDEGRFKVTLNVQLPGGLVAKNSIVLLKDKDGLVCEDGTVLRSSRDVMAHLYATRRSLLDK